MNPLFYDAVPTAAVLLVASDSESERVGETGL
jgi:hypothetical protein